MCPSLTRFVLAVGLVLLLSLAVAAAKPASSVVKGSVTYKGQPITGGTIAFHPARGKPVKASLEADGTYYAKNVPVGEVKVTIETESLRAKGNPKAKAKPPDKDKPKDKDSKPPVYVAIPKKYADVETTPLRLKVKGGKQTADFKLED
jgi:hypothetical protein